MEPQQLHAQATTNNKTLKELSLFGDDTVEEESVMIIMRSLHYNISIVTLLLPYELERNTSVLREYELINNTRRTVMHKN